MVILKSNKIQNKVFTFLSLFAMCFLFVVNAQTAEKHQEFIEILNRQYKTKKTSPLTKKDRIDFASLPFYDWDSNYRVIASLEFTPNSPFFVMSTTTGEKPLYQKYAIAKFFLDGKEIILNIYQSQQSKYDLQYKRYLFLPFRDKTNAKETYKGGRFLDVFADDIKNKQVILDFNNAYNPYCAYNQNYSCPIVPEENNLDIEIKAGVKKGIIIK